jgi:hypothetical protein
VREIATRLSEASAGLLGREVLRERVAGMLTASDLPLLNAYREFPDVYPGLYARLMGRRNGRKLRLYDAMPGAKEELRYPLFSHLVTQKARGVSGGFDRAHMDHAFRRYVRSQARGLGIDPGYVLGLTGVPMDGCKVPKGVNPWEYLRLTRVRQQEAARKSVEEAVRGMMLRNGRQSP